MAWRRIWKSVFNLFDILRRDAQPAGTFSGGEQQMLAIGRADDEPAQAVDARRAVDGSLAADDAAHHVDHRRTAVRGVTILLVEQNAQAVSLANYGYVLEVGKIVLEVNTGQALLVDDNVRKVYLGEDCAPGGQLSSPCTRTSVRVSRQMIGEAGAWPGDNVVSRFRCRGSARSGSGSSQRLGRRDEIAAAAVALASRRISKPSDPKTTARPASELLADAGQTITPKGSGQTRRCGSSKT